MIERRAGRWLALIIVAVAPLVVTSCGDDGDSASTTPTTFVKLDGTPRHPDAQGVLIDVAKDFSTLTLDDKRTYDVSPKLQSFATLDGSTQPLLRWKGQYVQVGLDGQTVEWLAGISSVLRVPGERDRVIFLGNLVRAKNGEAVFADGTVLDLAPGVTAPKPPAGAPADAKLAVEATIDAAKHHVVKLRLQ